MDEIDKRPTTTEVDPVKFLVDREKVRESRQKQRIADETHQVDTALKLVEPMVEAQSESNGNGASSE